MQTLSVFNGDDVVMLFKRFLADKLLSVEKLPFPNLRGGTGDAFSGAYVATAQHHGLCTSFLDFSMDPLVALHFATTGQNRKNDQRGVVFIVGIDDAINLGLRSILCPPYIKRAYNQRAVFVESDERTSDKLRQISYEFRFPLDASFEVLRDGIRVDLLSGGDWLDELAKRSKEWCTRNESDSKLATDLDKIIGAIASETSILSMIPELKVAGSIQTSLETWTNCSIGLQSKLSETMSA